MHYKQITQMLDSPTSIAPSIIAKDDFSSTWVKYHWHKGSAHHLANDESNRYISIQFKDSLVLYKKSDLVN